MTRRGEIVLEGLAFAEGPRWHEGRLYFSDMHAHEVVAMTPGGARETIYAADGAVSGLGWLPDGRMLVVSVEDLRLLRQEPDGSVSVHADLSTVATYYANDMVVDAQGRAYVGNVGYRFLEREKPKPARLARVDPDGSVHEAATDMMLANGSVITPDGKTLIVGESAGARLTAFDIAEDGSLANRRIWASISNGTPDGISLDAQGAIWIASPFTGEFLRVLEGGEIADRIGVNRMAIACMLGGEDRRTLYAITSESASPEKCRTRRDSRIEAYRIDVPGAGLP